jgi:hypothetical protein
MERIKYIRSHSKKLQVAVLRLKGFRKFGTQLGQIGACVCCHKFPYTRCKEAMRVHRFN